MCHVIYLFWLIPHFNCETVLHVCLYVSAVVIAVVATCLTYTSFSSGALCSYSNCHWSDCSSLDAMEAVIGHPRHSNQCHRYYQDFRHPGPRQEAQLRPKGSSKWGRGEALQLVMAAQRLDNCLSRCLSTAQRPACICSHHPAHWHFPLTECLFQPHHIPHTASLMELFSLSFSCCHTSPVTGSHRVQSTTVEFLLLQLIHWVHFVSVDPFTALSTLCKHTFYHYCWESKLDNVKHQKSW